MINTEIDFSVLLLIAVSLLLARLLGHLFNKIKQPAVIGEILAGFILGGLFFSFFLGQEFLVLGNKLTLPQLNFSSDVFLLFAEIGILFLLFISGLEMNIGTLKKVKKSSTFVAIGGVILPLILGVSAALILGFNNEESIVIGLILVATSVGVTVRTLMDLKVLHTDVAATILGGAVIDDVIGILLLAFVLSIESIFDAVLISIRVVIFFFIFLILGLKIIDKILDLGDKILLPKALLSISLSILLIYSFFADKAGISGIIGAFVAGLLIGHTIKSRKIIDDVQAVGYGFFIPLFFVSIGASLWQSKFEWDLIPIIILSIVLTIIGVLGKIAGCGIGAKIAGMTYKESLQIGIGMIPRMELALIIASSVIARGLLDSPEISHEILTATIILTIVTTVITPFLLKGVFKNR